MKTLILTHEYVTGELIKGVFFTGRQGDTLTLEDSLADELLSTFPLWFSVVPSVEEKSLEQSPENKMLKPNRRAIK